MLKTARMKLVELMILNEDIDRVLEYLGKKGNFQLRGQPERGTASVPAVGKGTLASLESARVYLELPDLDGFSPAAAIPSEREGVEAKELLDAVEAIRARERAASDAERQVRQARDEARAFANLKVAYSEFEHLSFLALRIGKIDGANVAPLTEALADRAVIVPLGDDRTRILAASSKKGRFALDSELKRFGFVALEVPKDFKGVPDDVLESLDGKLVEAERALEAALAERRALAKVHGQRLLSLIESYALESRIRDVRETLEGTELVYRVTGWIAEDEADGLRRDLDALSGGRVAIRAYGPEELSSIREGSEKVPVRFRHGPVVKSFEKMIFSYGAPLYGTIDPTPVVAVFFTLLFGIMFGDVGQGGVFVLLGLSLASGHFRTLARWRHFGPLFIAIGCASVAMGFLTGEFFANGEILKPVSRAVTAYFGEGRDRILELMPERGALSKLMYFFGFTLAIGFVINSIGLAINIVNQFSLGRPARAVFGRTGLCGAVFFWYAGFIAARFALARHALAWYDAPFIAVPLVILFFSVPITRLIEGEKPAFENGFFAAMIEGFVEILEAVSGVISNSVSFLRVGAFALSHAVLSYIVFTMTDLVGGSLSAGGLLVIVVGNAVIITLEGLIVAIQAVRLQYYEFFSKFFTETGTEFKPFSFIYKEK